MSNFLKPKQRTILQEAHHDSRLRKSADRIKTILLLDKGYSYGEVAVILLLDDMTIRRYEKEYRKNGIDGLLENRYAGSNGLLSIEEEKTLKKHLKRRIYSRVKDIIAYVQKTYGKEYSIEGMTHLLHRLNFSFKKTKVIPGKANAAKQEEFKKEYADFKQSKKAEDEAYFVALLGI
jgi:transposase